MKVLKSLREPVKTTIPALTEAFYMLGLESRECERRARSTRAFHLAEGDLFCVRGAFLRCFGASFAAERHERIDRGRAPRRQ